MSYSLNSPCYACSKKETCKDESKIKDAIAKIHETTFEDGHQGSGQIVLACVTQNRPLWVPK